MAKKVKIFLNIIILIFFLFPPAILAETPSIKVSYQTEYYLGTKGDAKVVFKIKIRNLRSDLYVKKFTLSFPPNFEIYNLEGYGNGNIRLDPVIKNFEDRISIEIELKNPSIGKGTENNLRLEFLQKKLIRIEGNIWEIILPTVDRTGKEIENYSVKVILPKDINKKLSLSKPRPTLIQGNTILWQDVKERVLYAVFGGPQYYKLDLKYAVENPKLVPAFIYVAFPPDTLYQKILVEKIDPAPNEINIDDDGNYLGKYFLKPKERLYINFKGFAIVYSQPRSDFYAIVDEQIKKQKNYLLRETKYWKLGKNVISISDKNLTTQQKAQLIFNFVVNKLSYGFNKLTQRRIERLGAEKALQLPTQAVCTEFTDLFIALARENGILAREIQGYGYSQDKRFRPLSLVTDVLHAWPEYYINERKIWIPVDPTWQDTSGIDYFSSLDFNHIAFVIHGKDDKYPLPAGSYKLEESKDVNVEPVFKVPTEKEIIRVYLNSNQIFGNYFLKNKEKKLTLKVVNEGNSFLINKTLEIIGLGFNLDKDKVYLDIFAPYQSKNIILKVTGKRVGKGKLIVKLGNLNLMEKEIEIKPGWYKYFAFVFQNWLYLSFIILIILIPLLLTTRAKLN